MSVIKLGHLFGRAIYTDPFQTAEEHLLWINRLRRLGGLDPIDELPAEARQETYPYDEVWAVEEA